MAQRIKTHPAWRAGNRLLHCGSRRPCKPQHEEAEIEHQGRAVGWAEDGVEDVELLAPIGVPGVEHDDFCVAQQGEMLACDAAFLAHLGGHLLDAKAFATADDGFEHPAAKGVAKRHENEALAPTPRGGRSRRNGCGFD